LVAYCFLRRNRGSEMTVFCRSQPTRAFEPLWTCKTGVYALLSGDHSCSTAKSVRVLCFGPAEGSAPTQPDADSNDRNPLLSTHWREVPYLPASVSSEVMVQPAVHSSRRGGSFGSRGSRTYSALRPTSGSARYAPRVDRSMSPRPSPARHMASSDPIDRAAAILAEPAADCRAGSSPGACLPRCFKSRSRRDRVFGNWTVLAAIRRAARCVWLRRLWAAASA
jgi:hypothetical protein